MFRRIAVLALGVVALAGWPADAQTFGRNKVHYEDFDFRILETPHFDIYYYPAERDAVLEAGRLAERWYDRLSRILDHQFRERQPIVLYASHAQFSQTNVVPGFLGEGIGGVTEHQRGRVVLPFAAGLGETDHVLGHELVHAFQRDILRRNGRSISTLPLWFVEGMAEYLSVGRVDPNTAMWLRDAVEQKHLPRIDQLANPKWFPYRYGQALWAYLASRFGEDVVSRCLKSKAGGGAVGRLVAVTGVDERALTNAWHKSLTAAAATARATKPAHPATAVITTAKGGGQLNVGPALSPDGKSVAFLSERDRYSISAYLADATTGVVRHTIIQTAGDPHFDSLQFIESAGAWDSTGRRFAVAAMSGGQPVLTILDIPNAAVEREIRLGTLDEVFSPTWSPDGRQLAFSAMKGGVTDIHVVDLATGDVRALTNDAFADLQPSWSPDGRTIAFSTDRFSSSLDTLTFGAYRLGLIDIATGTIRELPGMPGGKNIDPHWSADGSSVYFIADAGAVSNVYRVNVATGDRFQVTDVSTGISGVTALSPALSVAARADRIAFSVYRHGAYEIDAIEHPSGTPVLPAAPIVTAEGHSKSAPPAVGALAAAVPVLAPLGGTQFTFKPYHRGLSFKGAAQPYLSAGGGATGGFLRAGISLGFEDMLGDQQLQTTLQAGRSKDDFAVQAAYVNLRSRWNWAIIGGQVPWLASGLASSAPVRTADGGMRRDSVLLRQVHRQASGVAIYPFSGARRIELLGGVQEVTYNRATTTSVYSGVTGKVLRESTIRSQVAAPARMLESGVALVYDTAEFGPTSPTLGERYRFAIAPTFGNMSFATVTADYRRYFMPVRPFTVALRVMHLGRYGADARDPRLLPLVWTLRDVVRGYGDAGVFRPTTCTAASPSIACTSLGYLGASRLSVGNLELRFPLLEVIGHHARSAVLPIEAVLFSDAGTFTTPIGDRTAHAFLQSAGAGVRLNAAGVVFEFDAARRLDRASAGWAFAFNIRPGF